MHMSDGIPTTERQIPQRDPVIDGIRGVAILLVVLGHSLQHHLTEFNSNIIFKAIYSFHMPLFIAVSGYLAFGRIEARLPTLARNKAAHLVIPFLAWHFITYLMSALHVGQLSNPLDWYFQLLVSPDNGLWFLWVLFLCFVVAGIVTHLPCRFRDSALLGSALLLYVANYQPGGLPLLRWLYPFFVAGYLYAKHAKQIRLCPQLPIAILSITLWALLVPFFSCGNPMPIETLLTGWGLSGGSWLGLLLRYVIAGAGVIALTSMFSVWVRWSPIAIPLWLTFVGAASMDIYVSHQLFTSQPEGLVGPQFVPIAFVIGLTGSLCLSFFVLRRVTWLRCIFLGMWK